MLYIQCHVLVPLKTIIFLSRNSEEYGVEMEGLSVIFSGSLSIFSGEFYLQVSDSVMDYLQRYSLFHQFFMGKTSTLSQQFNITYRGVKFVFQLQGQMIRCPCVSSQFVLQVKFMPLQSCSANFSLSVLFDKFQGRKMELA